MSIKTILENFGTSLKEDLQKELLKKGVETNDGQDSRLGASIRFYFTNDGQTLNLALNDYYEAVDKGREPGKAPPVTPLIAWVKRKGLTFDLSAKRKKTISEIRNKKIKKALKQKSIDQKRLGLAIAISKSIGKYGTIKRFNYHGADFFDKVVQDGRIDQLKKELLEYTKQEIKVSINGK